MIGRKHLHSFTDRTGRPRAYFRRGALNVRLPATTDPLFDRSYRAVAECLLRGATKSMRRATSIGTIYLIRSGQFVKIGFTRNLPARLKKLRVGHPTPYSLLATFSGTLQDERQLHLALHGYRTTSEWFALDEAMTDRLKEQTEGGDWQTVFARLANSPQT